MNTKQFRKTIRSELKRIGAIYSHSYTDKVPRTEQDNKTRYVCFWGVLLPNDKYDELVANVEAAGGRVWPSACYASIGLRTDRRVNIRGTCEI